MGSVEQRAGIRKLARMDQDEAYAFILQTLDRSQYDAELFLTVAMREHPGGQRLAFFDGVCALSRFNKADALPAMVRVQKLDRACPICPHFPD